MMMLDARIGLDGARNRSDVIRQAIQQFLNGQPLVQGMDSVRIPLGHGDKRALGLLYELQGTTPEIAAQEGLSLYIATAVKAMQNRINNSKICWLRPRDQRCDTKNTTSEWVRVLEGME
jgi:hypothetical protein